MTKEPPTCWTVVRGAADGDRAARDAFARTYLPVVRGYLERRWRSPLLRAQVDDAAQEVFVNLFDEGGALVRVDRSRPGGFRAFLWGVTLNVARHVETRHARRREEPEEADLDDVPATDGGPSTLFDRAWARSVMRMAAARQDRDAAAQGADAVRRCDLLRLRFDEGLPIRDIAQRWNVDAQSLHRDYARARREFRAALREEVRFHHGGAKADVDAECVRLVALLR